MVGDALLDIIFAPEENDGVGMLIGEPARPDVSQRQLQSGVVYADVTATQAVESMQSTSDLHFASSLIPANISC